MSRRKIVIIGAGHVGNHVACALMLQDICEEIILLDKDEEKARCNAADLQDMACYAGKNVCVRAGGYGELQDAALCVIAYCGFIFEENRLEELGEALRIADEEILPPLLASGFQGVLVSITNPCDLVALYFRMRTGLRVVGTGTALDSARFRVRIGRALSVRPASVEAFCAGEHGDSQVPVWSQVRLGGRLLSELESEFPERFGGVDRAGVERDTIGAGWEIVTGKGSTEFGIGAAAAELIRAILTDSREILPCSYAYRREKDSPEIYTSIPSVLGAGGVLERIEPGFSKEEAARFEKSCRLMERCRTEFLDVRRQGRGDGYRGTAL